MQRNPYWPLKGPSFFSVLKSRRFVLFSLQESRHRLRIKFRGADGKPTTEPSQERRVNLDDRGPATVLICRPYVSPTTRQTDYFPFLVQHTFGMVGKYSWEPPLG
jgi:hypothetical protein